MNQVDVLRIAMKTDDPAFGQRFNHRCDQLIGELLPEIIDEELRIYQEAGIVVHVPSLTVDVGTLTDTEFQREYPHRFREALRQALASLFDTPHGHVSLEQRTEHADWFEGWCTFLMTGRLPWHLASRVRDINEMFRHVLAYHALAFKDFLVRMGHVSSLRQRLAAQFTDDQLLDSVALIHPTARDFLRQYVKTLTRTHQEKPATAVTGEAFRIAAWQVILAYVLTDRRSYFDKKSFLKWTIARLAGQYNTNYAALVDELTVDIGRFSHVGSISAELVSLLGALRAEAVATPGPADYPHRAMLLHMLATAESTRHFIRGMAEPDVHALVHMVMETPPEASFVIDYATLLDKQRSAIIGHRAGAAFRLLKWEIIFPLLTPYAMGGFNHRYFVRDVLSGISARYNLDVQVVVRWLHGTMGNVDANVRLKQVLDEWVDTFSVASGVIQPGGTADSLLVDNPSHWNRIFGNIHRLRHLAQDFTEEQHHRLVTLMYPNHATFLMAYADRLAALGQHRAGALIGDTDFRAVKWIFIYQTMLETQHQVFNKKGIVWRIIRGLAAHYHIAFEMLISTLYEGLDSVRSRVPFDLFAAISAIHDEQHSIANQRMARQRMYERFAKVYGTAEATILHTALNRRGAAIYRLPYALLEELIAAELTVYRRLKTIAGLSYDRAKWVQLLANIIRRPHLYNQQTALWEWIAMLWKAAVAKRQSQELLQALLELSGTIPLLAGVANRMPLDATGLSTDAPEKSVALAMADQAGEPTFVDNAGLVILAPFLPKLFAQAGYLENGGGGFIDRDHQVRAIFLMQYLVYGIRPFPEYTASLDKLLCGFQTGIPIPRHIDLSEKETALADGLLAAVLQHWKKLNTSTVEALRQAFLQRGGRLTADNEDKRNLHVEGKAYDMLLDSLPWDFSVIRFRWMKQGLWVKWR